MKTIDGNTGVQLRNFNNSGFDRGAPLWKEALWLFVQALLVRSWVPGSRHRCLLLRWFGARIGERVLIKPGVRVKFPWRLEVGCDVWLGEDVWIDNLALVSIGDNVCISQGAYLCTGSHDWRDDTFSLITKSIVIEPEAWIGANACLAPGVRIHSRAVLALGSVATSDAEGDWIHQGNPALPLKPRSKPNYSDTNV